jgi:hypothetical protein
MRNESTIPHHRTLRRRFINTAVEDIGLRIIKIKVLLDYRFQDGRKQRRREILGRSLSDQDLRHQDPRLSSRKLLTFSADILNVTFKNSYI